MSRFDNIVAKERELIIDYCKRATREAWDIIPQKTRIEFVFCEMASGRMTMSRGAEIAGMSLLAFRDLYNKDSGQINLIDEKPSP